MSTFHDVAIHILRRIPIHIVPTAHICPTKGTYLHIHVGCSLYHRIVNRNIGERFVAVIQCRTAFVAIGFFGKNKIEPIVHIRYQLFHGRDNGLHIPYEKARIPEKLSTLYKQTCEIKFRLFGKGLHLSKSIYFIARCLYIAIACLRMCRTNTYGHQTIVLSNVCKRFFHVCNKLILIQYELV